MPDPVIRTWLLLASYFRSWFDTEHETIALKEAARFEEEAERRRDKASGRIKQKAARQEGPTVPSKDSAPTS